MRHSSPLSRLTRGLFATAVLAACADSPVSTVSTLRGPSTSSLALAKTQAARYEVQDLGTLGGSFSIALGINNKGDVGGGANTSGEVEHFFLWHDGTMTDAGSLGGNANAGGPNARGQLAGLSETSSPDPSGEDYCGFGTHLVCLGAVWERGVLTPLPTLGGRNAEAINLNDRGQIVGLAETNVRDPSCSVGTPFQLYEYEAVVWGPKPGEIHALPPLPGDRVGFAEGINDHDQVVGSTGSCAATVANNHISGPHAVLWDHGTPIALDPPRSNKTISTAFWINNRGEVVGTSGNAALHTFLWTKATGMRDLGTVGTDLGSIAFWINSEGQAVGTSCIDDGLCNGDIRAFIWENDVMSDLNELVVGESPIYMLIAFAINNSGQVVGLGLNTTTFEAHAFLATPIHGGTKTDESYAPRNATRPTHLPEIARTILLRKLGLQHGKSR